MDWEFRRAGSEDFVQMQRLWKQCFPEDDSAFIQRFFLEIPFGSGFAACKGEVLAMLFLLPAQVKLGAQTVSVRYLYAGCTHPAHRGLGIYPRLMQYAASQAAEDGAAAIYLCPASPSLADYYRRLGYRDGIGGWFTENAAPPENRRAVDVDEYLELREKYIPADMPVWRLDPFTERFFCREMMEDGWRAVAFPGGCGLFSDEDTVGYDVLSPQMSREWKNTAQWIPLAESVLSEWMRGGNAYTAFLGDS